MRAAWLRFREWASHTVLTNDASVALLFLDGSATEEVRERLVRAMLAPRPSVRRLAARVLLDRVPESWWQRAVEAERRLGYRANLLALDASLSWGPSLREKLAWGLVERALHAEDFVWMEEEDRGVRSMQEIVDEAWPYLRFERERSRRVTHEDAASASASEDKGLEQG